MTRKFISHISYYHTDNKMNSFCFKTDHTPMLFNIVMLKKSKIYCILSIIESLKQLKEQIHTFIHPFIHLNIYLSLENHWCFPHLEWRPNPGHWVKQMKSTLLSENMHTAVKWFEIIDLNCPQLVSVEDVLKITACARHTKTKKLEADVLCL